MSDPPEVQRRVPPLMRSLWARLAALWAGIRRVPASALDGLRHDPARGRRALLSTIGITVAATAMVTVILTVLALSSSASTADRLAAAGDVLVGATLLLAAIAAVVALLAYAVSTGAPNLQFSVNFNDTSPTRRLPDLLFTQLWHKPEWGTPTLTFEILAEGYRKEITLPVDFIVDGKSQFPREGGKINPEWI